MVYVYLISHSELDMCSWHQVIPTMTYDPDAFPFMSKNFQLNNIQWKFIYSLTWIYAF